MRLSLFGCIAALIIPMTALADDPIAEQVSCATDGEKIEITFASAPEPRNFTVLRPDGGMVFISSTDSDRDYRTHEGVPKTLVVYIDQQRGEQYAEDGAKHPRLVFTESGIYTLLFSDPRHPQTSVEGHSCKVVISDSGSASIAMEGEQPRCNTRLGGLRDSGCRPSDGCRSGGHGYCCSHSSPSSPCYCNDCCIATRSTTI